MILIHCALLCEAQIFIESLKLKKTNSFPKIYSNDKYIALVSGVGKENTINGLNYIFNKYTIQKALNIGIAGSADTSINIGEIFSINHNIKNIKSIKLSTVDKIELSSNKKDRVYDMEGNYFLEYCQNKLEQNNIYIIKIVSDHLEDKILSKEFIKQLINKHKKIILEISST
ncbi:MAG: hypothetical protein U9O56_03000 [Campylobacterota bacterium]|nr:hypothetical protein [Campylobacterota bacterium]